MRRLAVLHLTIVALLILALPAAAHWTSPPSIGTASVGTATLSAPTLAAPASAGHRPTITFADDAEIVGAPSAPAVTYVVQRRAGSGAYAPVATGPCAGRIPDSIDSCVDAIAADGTYTYRAVAHAASWTATSPPVTLSAQDAVPMVTAITPIDPSPTNASALRWRLVLTEPVTGLDPADFVLSTTGVGGAAVSSVTGSGTTFIITVSTSSGSGSVELNLVDNDSVGDNVDQPLGGSGPGNGSFAGGAYTLDRAAPQLTRAEMLDANGNGYVDRVAVTFDSAIEPSTRTGNWTLTNAPSGATLASVSTSGSTATLVLNEGAGAANTAVGLFTVTLSGDPDGIRDSIGNQSSFTARAPADKAGPALLAGITESNATLGTDGKLELGDSLTLPFSEPIATGSLLGVPTISQTRTATGNAVLTIGGVLSASDLGSPAYLSGAGSASFVGVSTLIGSSVRVVAGVCSSGCGLPAAPATAPTATFVPAGTLTDAAGNAAAGTRTLTAKVF